MKFLLESTKRIDGTKTLLLPKYDFVYSLIEAVDFHNWQCEEEIDTAIFLESFSPEHLKTNCIPVGSVEFCLDWYRQMGVPSVSPLNIPECLDPLVKRKIVRTNSLNPDGFKYFGKSMKTIKSSKNGWYERYHGEEQLIFTKEVKGVRSEWRAFVCDGEIMGMKCYIGSPFAPPDIKYCNSVIEAMEKKENIRSYTLDLMVLEDGITDVLELHDFFACGIYGFSNLTALRKMSILTQRKLLGRL